MFCQVVLGTSGSTSALGITIQALSSVTGKDWTLDSKPGVTNDLQNKEPAHETGSCRQRTGGWQRTWGSPREALPPKETVTWRIWGAHPWSAYKEKRTWAMQVNGNIMGC